MSIHIVSSGPDVDVKLVEKAFDQLIEASRVRGSSRYISRWYVESIS